MKRYKITLISRWSEPFIVTVTANSLDEAMNNIDLAPGWEFAEYREI